MSIYHNISMINFNSKGFVKISRSSASLLLGYHLHTYSQTTQRLAVSAVYPLFRDRFGCSLLFCQLECDNEAISDGWKSENAGIGD